MPAPKKYPDELRERAVRLVLESGRPIAHIAKDLGIHREALRQWVRRTHGVEVKYKTLYTIVRTRFKTKLKVARPTHTKKP